MATVTLSSKNQITLPAEIVRGLQLEPGAKLVAELIDDHIVLLPKPESWVNYFKGSMKGVYGSTKEEIDRYIAEERRSPEREEWREQFDDLVATHEEVRVVVDALKSSDCYTASPVQLFTHPSVQRKLKGFNKVRPTLDKMVERGWVRRIPLEGNDPEVYRLVHELAAR